MASSSSSSGGFSRFLIDLSLFGGFWCYLDGWNFESDQISDAFNLAVLVECANLCNISKGEGSGRYECSVLSCAWKAPRVLTGSLASTTLPRCSEDHRDVKGVMRRPRWLCHVSVL